MTTPRPLYRNLLKIAASIRADGTSARFVSMTAEDGHIRCRVTTASDRAPNAAPPPSWSRQLASGAALHEAAAGFARDLVEQGFGDFLKSGGRGVVTIGNSGGVILDLETRDGEVIACGPACLEGMRKRAMSGTAEMGACLAASLSDDARFPLWLASEETQRRWMQAALELDPDAGSSQPGLSRAADLIHAAFQPEGLTPGDIERRLESRLYPDLLVDRIPDAPRRTPPEGLGSASAWLPLDALETRRLYAALEDSPDPVLASVLDKLHSCLSDVAVDESFRAAAIEKYAGRLPDGDLDFQADGTVSRGDEGGYVMAFLWVSNAEAGIDEPRDDADMDLSS